MVRPGQLRGVLGAARPRCGGTGFGQVGLTIRLGGLTYPEVIRLPVEDLRGWLDTIGATLTPTQRKVADDILPGLTRRVRLMVELGLGHLQVTRSAPSMSGGELQRARITAQLNTDLTGIVFVLDEPGAGLHPSDVQRVVDAFDTLLAGGNSVVIAEHDLHVAACADWIIDMGPGAGDRGGRVVNEGPPATIAAGPGVTAGYLRPLVAG